MRVRCVDCGEASPSMPGVYELMGEEGWRPMRADGPSGYDWRCPACWTVFKDAMSGGLAISAGFQAAAPVRDDEAAPEDDLARSGERFAFGADAEARTALASRMLVSIFKALSKAAPSPELGELQARAVEHQSAVWRWRATPPSRADQLALLERLSRIQERLVALEPTLRAAGPRAR